jgi:hypothetical protein
MSAPQAPATGPGPAAPAETGISAAPEPKPNTTHLDLHPTQSGQTAIDPHAGADTDAGNKSKAGKLLGNTAPKDGDLGGKWLAQYTGPRPELTDDNNGAVRNRIDKSLLPIIFLIYFSESRASMRWQGRGLVSSPSDTARPAAGQELGRVCRRLWLPRQCQSLHGAVRLAHHDCESVATRAGARLTSQIYIAQLLFQPRECPAP